MNRKLALTTAAAAALTFTSCNIFIEVTQTTIRAQNDLTDLIVGVNGVDNQVDKIDLKNVTIGDVTFDRINAGVTTESVETEESGTVDIDVGSAVATVSTVQLGQIITTTIPITGIATMETDIADGEDNTVYFNKNTAAAVLNLAKKLAAKK